MIPDIGTMKMVVGENTMDDIITINGVRYFKENEYYKSVIEDMEYNVNSTLEHAEKTYNAFDAENLTVNKIEAEGFLRCAKHIYQLFQQSKSMNGDVDNRHSEE